MNAATPITPRDATLVERSLRIDLAAAFRLAARHGWHEAVANHFSLAVSDDGKRFLMNPRWRHFSRIRASDLLLLDSADHGVMQRADAPDPSAWCIHSQLHARVPQARCVLHVHSTYATALAALADPTLQPVDQNTARFYQRVAIDQHFGGIADSLEEGARLAAVLGRHRVLLMGNHGVLVTGPTVAAAFDELYYFERAAQTLMLAYSSGQPLNILSHEMAERTARDWEAYGDAAAAHFEELKCLLDAEGADYRD
ncbi:MAG: class II aldolase/adducin family protein [Steroidobacteraceae bacterium]